MYLYTKDKQPLAVSGSNLLSLKLLPNTPLGTGIARCVFLPSK